MDTRVIEPEDLVQSIVGLTIIWGGVGDGGVHFRMSDGRILIIQGQFLVSVCTLEGEERTLQ